MKKIISLVLAVALLFTMIFTSTFTVNAENVVKTTEIDLTQDVANLFATTGSTTATTATVENGKLKVNISAYERHLTSQSYGNLTWFPTYLLASEGSTLKLTQGSKAIVEVKYKVVSANANATWGAQIGIGNFKGGKGNNIYVRASKKHTSADIGNEFTFASTFTVDEKYATKIGFAGGGTIEISSIVVHELPAEHINDYAVVKYVDGNDETTEFVSKNSAPKVMTRENSEFVGWYASSDFSGDAVTSVTADTTLYAKWVGLATYDIVRTESTTPDNLVGASSNVSISMSGTKISTGSYNGYNLSTSGWSSWRPAFFFLTESGGTKSSFMTKANAKYIVEMEYVVTSTRTDNHSLQVGLFGNIGANGQTESARWLDTDENGEKLYKTHPAADNGKTIRYTVVFTAESAHNMGLIFYGQGSITLNSIKVSELPGDGIQDFAVVNYVDNGKTTTEFVKKNSEPKALTKAGCIFSGWYASSDFSGEAVTSVTADTTLYAKWIEPATYDIVRTESTTPDNLVGASSNVSISMSGTKISTGSYNGYNLSTSGWSSWRPAFFFLTESGGTKSSFMTKANAKYIVEMEYVVTSNRTDNHSLQVGLFGNIGANGQTESARWLDTDENGEKLYKTHPAADNGKTIRYTVVFTAESAHNMGLIFYGQGSITLNSIKVSELPGELIDDYAMVSYDDDYIVSTEFALKNTALKTPKKENQKFLGWYDENNIEKVTVTEDMTVKAAWLKGGNVDLTKSVKIDGDKATLTPTIPTDATTPLNVKIQGFNGILMDKDTEEVKTDSWTAGALIALKYSDDSYVGLRSGSKYVVNVEYDVTHVATESRIYHPQIAIVYNNNTSAANVLADNGTKIMTAKKHGETVTNASISCVISGVEANALRLAFDGQGTFDIKSVTVTEMVGNVEMNIVTYQDTITSINKIAVAENGSAIADLPRTLLHNFGGWYNGEEKVTTVSGDATLTAKWFDKADVTMNGETDVVDIVRIKKALANESKDLVYDIDRDNTVVAADLTILRRTLLGCDVVTIAGNDIATYSVTMADNASFLTTNATESLVDSLFGVDLSSLAKTSSENEIVVGISNVDESGALENLTGVKGDVYGLDDYKIFLDGNKLYIEAGSDYATAFAVNKFVDFIGKYKTIPAGFVLSGKYNGENNLLDGYSYVWGDEFNSELLDTGKWLVETAEKPGPYYSRSSSYYMSTALNSNWNWIDVENDSRMQDGVVRQLDEEGNNYYLENGLLVMKTGRDGENYYATKISAKNKFNFTYGIMTARVKLATKNGACSTLWSRTLDDNGASVNEFDFVENFGADQIVPNLHTWVNYTDHTNHKDEIDSQNTIYPADGESLSDSFHEISLYWDEEKIVFYFDGVPYLEQDIGSDPEKWEAFHKSTYMIMGVSAPTDFYGTYNNGTTPGDILGTLVDSFNESFYVDYIRVFQK